jgi:hypothetical protein
MRARVMEMYTLGHCGTLIIGRNMQTVSVNDPLTPTYISPLQKKKLGDETFLLFHRSGIPKNDKIETFFPLVTWVKGRRARSEDRCEFEGYCIY